MGLIVLVYGVNSDSSHFSTVPIKFLISAQKKKVFVFVCVCVSMCFPIEAGLAVRSLQAGNKQYMRLKAVLVEGQLELKGLARNKELAQTAKPELALHHRTT